VTCKSAGRVRARNGRRQECAPLWLVDWSDSEDDDFRQAWRDAEIESRVVRVRPTGPHFGARWGRLRNWPRYIELAARGVAMARGAPIVAWQPVSGAAASMLPSRRSSPVVLLNALLDVQPTSRRQQMLLAGARRADHNIFYSRAALKGALDLGIAPSKATFLPLGAPARRHTVLPPGGYLLAAGRSCRDWETLVRAAEGLGAEIRVMGPPRLPGVASVRVVPQVSREGFLAMLEGAVALVVPLHRTDRTAGQLAVLDAMSVGRAVVATRSQGTEDYVDEGTGILVPPHEPLALRDALRRILQPGVAKELGEAALEAVKGRLSLERFVRDVDTLATEA